MKLANISKGLLLGLALILATSAFAASTNKGSVDFLTPVVVAGKQLPAGSYSVKWEGTGQNVELNILQGNKVVLTTPARMVDLTEKSESNAAVVKQDSDGSRSLTEIHFSGKKYALAVGSESAMNGGSSK